MARIKPSMFEKLDQNGIDKLKNFKINTVVDFAGEDTEKLIKITELTFKDIDDIKKQIFEKYSGKIKNPIELLAEQKNICSTGISNLDNLLNGGMCPGCIYEICGKSSAGKTQLCYTLAVNVGAKLSEFIHYICTKEDFSASRIQSIIENKNINDELTGRIMDRIKVTHIKNIYELFSVLHNFILSFKTNSPSEKTRLIIIDALPSIFLMTEGNDDNFYLLNHLSNICHCLASEYSLSIITVNSVTQSWRETQGFDVLSSYFKTNPSKPTLGKYWLCIPNTRLLIEKIENETRKIRLWNCENAFIESCIQVVVGDAGVT